MKRICLPYTTPLYQFVLGFRPLVDPDVFTLCVGGNVTPGIDSISGVSNVEGTIEFLHGLQLPAQNVLKWQNKQMGIDFWFCLGIRDGGFDLFYHTDITSDGLKKCGIPPPHQQKQQVGAWRPQNGFSAPCSQQALPKLLLSNKAFRPIASSLNFSMRLS